VTDTQLGMLIVAAAFGAILVGGLVTRKMLLPPILSFERDTRPAEFWLAAVFNATLACLALWAATR